MLRHRLYADPTGVFLHKAVLESCLRNATKTALIDTSCNPHRQISYAEYGNLVEQVASGLVGAGVMTGQVVAIHLPNSWEYGIAYHAAMLAGGIPTLMNPSYKEREIRYQLESSGATILISHGSLLQGVNLRDLPNLKKVFTIRERLDGTFSFADLLTGSRQPFPEADQPSHEKLASLPFSSGTTGLPKGVMLSHSNLVSNVYQVLAPNTAPFNPADVMMCFLPLYHIYGLTVCLNTQLIHGATLVLMPRFDVPTSLKLITEYGITTIPVVPPILNAFVHAAEKGIFPKDHHVTWSKCGAAPLAPELARRFTALTGILLLQGYGMTEASPVTHAGSLKPEFYRPDSIGWEVAKTDCRILDESGNEIACDEAGELVMRGPQIMSGYWNDSRATSSALRDGWYWSGDVARRDDRGFYFIVDRRKEMIKYKGFAIAPAEVESVLLEHPAVRDCGVIGKRDEEAGEVPCAFVVLHDGYTGSQSESELASFTAERLTGYKQPRDFRFIEAIPRNPSGKVLRGKLRELLK